MNVWHATVDSFSHLKIPEIRVQPRSVPKERPLLVVPMWLKAYVTESYPRPLLVVPM